jgi:hypothetical protein
VLGQLDPTTLKSDFVADLLQAQQDGMSDAIDDCGSGFGRRRLSVAARLLYDRR